MIAMQGQRYPVSEIGMIRLGQRLIQRGEHLRGETGISITTEPSTDDPDRVEKVVYTIARSQPTGRDDDFRTARITIDFQRQLILGYESDGWPPNPDAPPPLIESYRYENVRPNVGLSDADFEVTNPAYHFP